MAETKTKPTKVSVDKFIAGVENDIRRADAKTLLKVFKESTGWKAQMLGPTIIGFGLYPSQEHLAGHPELVSSTSFNRDRSRRRPST